MSKPQLFVPNALRSYSNSNKIEFVNRNCLFYGNGNVKQTFSLKWSNTNRYKGKEKGANQKPMVSSNNITSHFARECSGFWLNFHKLLSRFIRGKFVHFHRSKYPWERTYQPFSYQSICLIYYTKGPRTYGGLFPEIHYLEGVCFVV